ncbi:MAG: helix-turn-helix transcriptional regulator [Clostridia bacterium]|nr:helix-turn-helix transcriptional regulator [Clostridia bacterium]
MNYETINPCLRTAAYLAWNLKNIHKSVAYHMRFFAIRKNPAIVRIRDSETRVSQESLVILKPGIPYDFCNAADTEPFHLYSCNFDLTQEYRNTISSRNPVHEPNFVQEYVIDTAQALPELDDVIVLQNCPILCQQVQHIYELYITKQPYSEEIASGIIKSVLFEALQQQNSAKHMTAKSHHSAEIARVTLQYIREHCSEHINEQSIAAAMGYHPYYLSRLTQLYYSITPYRYLMQCRLEYAVHLLCSTDLSIGAVAEACGFSTQAHFSAFVRRETGMSPNVLRKNGWHGGTGTL